MSQRINTKDPDRALLVAGVNDKQPSGGHRVTRVGEDGIRGNAKTKPVAKKKSRRIDYLNHVRGASNNDSPVLG